MNAALGSLKWTEPAVDVCRLGVFVVFVVLGLFVARGASRPGGRRRVDALLAYVLAVTGLVGLVQKESWPFTQWALVSGLGPSRIRSLHVDALDATGRAYPVDLRVVQPLSPEELASWLYAYRSRLGSAGEQALARFLLERAEQGRQRLLRGERVAPNQWLLGPLAAPYHFRDARTWSSADQVPRTPFVGLEAYFVEWDVEERLRDPGRTSRSPLFELHGDPRS
jgi:hypothetical protein